MWHVNTLEYYLDLKRNGILMHAATWMNLEKIMLSGTSLFEKTLYSGPQDSVYMKWANAQRDRIQTRVQGFFWG